MHLTDLIFLKLRKSKLNFHVLISYKQNYSPLKSILNIHKHLSIIIQYSV